MRGGLGTLPCLILISGLFFIPESPRWLAKMGKTEDFEASLQVLRGFDTDITQEINEYKMYVASSNRKAAMRFSDLKQRRYWFPLMVIMEMTDGGTDYCFECVGLSSRVHETWQF